MLAVSLSDIDTASISTAICRKVVVNQAKMGGNL